MNDWLKTNAWSLIIASVTFVGVFTTYGYKLETVQAQVQENKASISLLNTQQTQVQVQLAQLSTDISYIRASIDRIIR